MISSNRIEGVEVDQSRIGTVIFGKSALRDRDEEEVRGYRDALKLIHERGARLPISEATIKKLHQLSRGEVWDAGAYYAPTLFYKIELVRSSAVKTVRKLENRTIPAPVADSIINAHGQQL